MLKKKNKIWSSSTTSLSPPPSLLTSQEQSVSLSPSSMINTEGEEKKRERKMLQRLERQGSHSRPISLWHMPVTGCLHLSVKRNCSYSLSSLSQQSNTAHRRRARAPRSRLWKASVHTIAEEGEGDNLWVRGEKMGEGEVRVVTVCASVGVCLLLTSVEEPLFFFSSPTSLRSEWGLQVQPVHSFIQPRATKTPHVG